MRVNVKKLVDDGDLLAEGQGSGTRYRLSDSFLMETEFIEKVIDLGVAEYARRKRLVGNVQDSNSDDRHNEGE